MANRNYRPGRYNEPSGTHRVAGGGATRRTSDYAGLSALRKLSRGASTPTPFLYPMYRF